jgi:hypothetical protein
MKAWVASLGPDEVISLARAMVSGDRVPGLMGAPEGTPENAPIELPDPPDQPELLTVHLSLDDTEPLIWRRLTLPGDLDLGRVHEVIQAAMGWSDSHLHRFFLDEVWSYRHFVTEEDLDEGEEGTREDSVRLDQVLRVTGDTLTYIYDFGDGWEHTLVLEDTAPLPATPTTSSHDEAGPAAYGPVTCHDGAGACPPEDVGGIPGYEEMAEWARHDLDDAHAPPGQDADELRSWIPRGWHPDTFSVDEVNEELARLRPRS